MPPAAIKLLAGLALRGVFFDCDISSSLRVSPT